jgi:hypothetical protein
MLKTFPAMLEVPIIHGPSDQTGNEDTIIGLIESAGRIEPLTFWTYR